MSIEGKTAIVTGAAHRVGKGIAVSLAKKGCNIIVHYGTSKDKAEQTVRELQDIGVEATAVSINLKNIKEIENYFDELSSTFNLDILVNSAASFEKADLLDTSLTQWNNSMNVNLRAPFLLIKHAAPYIEKGLIVNISDLSGIFAWKSFASHSVSKAALIHLTKVAARELAPQIRVNAILPGPILPPPEMDEKSQRWKEMIENIPMKKSGHPENIGQTVVYFAENDFITGSIVNVDGGEALVGTINH